MGRSGPHLIHGCLTTPEPTTPTASRSVRPLLHSSPNSVICFTISRPLPPQNCPFPWRSGFWTPPSSTWFLGSIRANNPKKNPYGISIGPAVFAGGHYCDGPTDRPSDRPTDQATRSVTKKPHLYVRIVLQCGLIK